MVSVSLSIVLVLLVQRLKPMVCFAFVWGEGGGGVVLTVVSLFATVVTVIGQRIPVIFELIMMAAYSELIRLYNNITVSNPVHCVHFCDQFCLSCQFVSSS